MSKHITISVRDGYQFETITVSTVVVRIDQNLVNPTDENSASKLFCSVEGAGLRYRFDGNDPTSAIGHPLADGDSVEIDGINNINNFRAIRSGGSDATLVCTLSK